MRGSVLGMGLSLVATLLLGFYLAAALLRSGGIARFMLSLPIQTAHESLAAARARVYGADYSRAVDEIRQRLPIDRPYVMVAGDGLQSGGVYRVRYDLAPRRAVYIGQLDRLTGAGSGGLRRALCADRLQVIVAYGDRPPRRYDCDRFVQELERGAAKGPLMPAHVR